MALMLADTRTAWVIFTTPPADPEKVTVAEWDAAKNIACNLEATGSTLGAVASSEVSEELLCGRTVTGYGSNSYQGQATVYRHYDSEGKPEETADATFEAMKTKGTVLHIGKRYGPAWNAKGDVGQEISVYKVNTDIPQSQESTGFIKTNIGLGVEGAWENTRLVES